MKQVRDELELLSVDGKLIAWLLFDAPVTRYQISKDLGMAESTLSRIYHGETDISGMRCRVGTSLTGYARKLKRKLDKEKKVGETNE